MNALEVLINGKRIGIYVPPAGSSFGAMVGNIPRNYMRAHIMTSNDAESWQWQLPNIKPGQLISDVLRTMLAMIAASGNAIAKTL